MGSFKEPSLAERQKAANTAKKAALKAFRENLSDPALAQRQVARHVTRITRAAERKAVKMAREVELAEQAARDQERAKQAELDAAAKAEQHAAQVVAREAEFPDGRIVNLATSKLLPLASCQVSVVPEIDPSAHFPAADRPSQGLGVSRRLARRLAVSADVRHHRT